MKLSEAQNRGARFLLVSASLVIVIAGLKAIKTIALPLLIAMFLSVLSAPMMTWLLRRRVPKALTVILTVLANIAILAIVVLMVGGSIRAFVESLPQYQERLEMRATSAFNWLEDRGIDTSDFDWIQDLQQSQELEPLVPPPEIPDRGASSSIIALGDLVGVVTSTLRGIVSLVAMAFLVFLVMIFVLLEAAGLPHKLELAFGWGQAEMYRMSTVKREVQRYLGYKTLISLLTGVLIGLWCWNLGVRFPVLWGLIAFILNYIPSLGSIIASVPTVLLALIDLGTAEAILVGLGYLVINITLGNFLEPQLMGRRLGMSPLVVFLSLVFWGWVWGPIGMLLSVPLTMILRIALENTEDFRWLAQLIAANAANAVPSTIDSQ